MPHAPYSRGDTTGMPYCWLPLRLARSLLAESLFAVRAWPIVQTCVSAEVVLVLVLSFSVLKGLWSSLVPEAVPFLVWWVLRHRRQAFLLRHCQWLVVGSVIRWSAVMHGCWVLSQV